MTTADKQLARWAAKELRIESERVQDVEFVIEESYTSDAGTYWPPEAKAVVKVGGYSTGRTRKREIYISNADTTELIRDILNA